MGMKTRDLKFLLDWLGYALMGIGVAALLFFAAPAHAEDVDGRWVKQTIRQQYRVCNDWTGDCYRRWREREVWRYRAPVYSYVQRESERVDRYERDEREACKDRKRVVGTEHATVEGALAAAKRAWASMVRWDHGEKYMNIDIANGYSQRCERSSTNETTAGRVAESIAGAFYSRCEVVASPCVARRVQPENDRR